MEIDPARLYSFLRFGYFLDFNPSLELDFSMVERGKYNSCSEEELIGFARSTLRQAIEELFQENREHLVFLSGGYDSRAILSTLVEFTEASRIKTLTYGTPGTLDYKIGNKMARKFGTRHLNFRINRQTWSEKELSLSAERFHYQSHLFLHPPTSFILDSFGDHLAWTGFMAGILAGAHVPQEKSIEDANELAFRQFYIYNDFSGRFLWEPLDVNPENHLDFKKELEGKLTNIDNLDIFNKQLKYTAPVVLFKGMDYANPFIHPKVMGFWLSLPDEYRYRKKLYETFLKTAFPEWFSYPCAANGGLGLFAKPESVALKKKFLQYKAMFAYKLPFVVHPFSSYFDANREIRYNKSLRKLIAEMIRSFKDRKVLDWLDPEALFLEHIHGKGYFGSELILMASLEILLRCQPGILSPNE